MRLVGAGQQQAHHPFYDASGTITTGGTAQLVLAISKSRTFLKIQNLSSGPLYFEFGPARATATISGGAVTGVSISNGGFGYTVPPTVYFFGGGTGGNGAYLGLNQPNGESPSAVAQAHATLSGGAVNAITIDNGGAGYVKAPYVFLVNSGLDPYGCATPSASVGMLIPSQTAPYILNGTACTTDQISVFGATTGQAYMVKWMD